MIFYTEKRKKQLSGMKTGVRSTNYYRESFERLRENKAAMAGLAIIVIFIILAVFAPAFAPYDPYEQLWEAKLTAPSAEHLAGTDELGRDILSRLIYGARISLSIGFMIEIIAMLIGLTLGCIAGYYGGIWDSIIMRLTDIVFAFPSLIFAIAIMFALGPGLINVFLALSLISWAGTARLIRGQVLQIKKLEYVEACRAIGEKDIWIIMKHIIPNCLPTIIVIITLGIPDAIMSEASLSFLGLGAQPPMASWGSMIYTARSYIMQAPTYSVFPGICIMLLVLAFNILGDRLRDALDPRLKD
ncbi:MAG TPA: ABC transporter permease [Negativicutes bacterium]|nr:ABC transporter permease [Negativicutes bacterium]